MGLFSRILPGAKAAGLLVIACLSVNISFAQQQRDKAIQAIERNKVDHTPTSISFIPGAQPQMKDAQNILKQYLGISGPDNAMVLQYHTTTKKEVTTERYYQYYKGIKVEYGSYSLAGKNGVVDFITGNYYNTSGGISPVPVITAAAAFGNALNYVGAEKYKWQDPSEEAHIKVVYHNPDTSYKPHGVLAWIEDYNSDKNDRVLHLAWSFDIYAISPLSRQKVFIDAVTGKVLFSNSLIKHTATTGATLYSGTVPIQTSLVLGPTYELFDSTRGNGVHTMNMNDGSSYGAATEYTSLANMWPMAVPDSCALDAHWGAEVVYDYWKDVQGRLSWDNMDGILNQYVHYETTYDNAFWDGAEMTYGDGSGCGGGGFTSLVSLDVTAHEIGHGVCQATCNLIYAKEPGGIDEGLSDCWGATIENWGNPHEVDAVPKSTWEMGEEIGCGNPLRRIDFPKIKDLPDTYLGTYWYGVTSCTPGGGNDECGVHTNMGVISKWYYLVTMGGSGTNDIGNTYTVTGQGFPISENILYQTELVLANNADYPALRTTSINTTITLYGNCSPEVIAVTNAWYGVGVGAAYVPLPLAITTTVNVCVGGSLTLTDPTPGGTWTSGDIPVATIGSTTALLNGITVGVAPITYSMGGSCIATTNATVNAYPTATISPVFTAILCSGSAVTLTATAGTGYTYQWKLAGTTIPGATNGSYNATAGGSYTVVVTNSAGCGTTSAATVVTPVAPPVATITAATPTTFCSGGSAILNADAGVGFTYHWQLGGVPVAGATSISYTTGTGGNYTVVVTNSSGCSTTSATTILSVTPLPPATITPIGATTFCAPGTVLLNANTGAGITYQWQSGGISIGGATSSGYTASLTGSYKVIVTQLGCSSTSAALPVSAEVLAVAPVTGATDVCVGQSTPLADATAGGSWSSGASAIAVVNVSGIVTGISGGVAPISYSFTNTCGTIVTTNAMTVHAPTAVAGISGTMSVCAGSTTPLADATPSGVWSSVAPAIATVSTTGIVTGVAAGSVPVSYTVTNTFGCISAAVATMTVQPLPSGTISPAGPVAICPGGNTVLAAPAGLGYTYQWLSGGTSIPGATNENYTANAAGAFRASITSAVGCNTVSSFVVVSVSSALLVTPSVAIAANPGNILCVAPSPVTFSATSVNGGTAPAYQWFVNGAGVGAGATYGYTPAGGDVVRCLLISNNNCASPDTASGYMTMIISPLQSPAVTITDMPAEICAGNIVTFTANPVYGGVAPTYRWSRNDTNIATGPEYVYLAHNGDFLNVTLFSDYPCLLTDSAHSPVFHVTTHSTATNAVNITVTQAGILEGSTDTFTATATNGGGSPAYQWLLNGVAIPGATASTYVTSTLLPGEVISCKETSSQPCADPATATSGGITVHVVAAGVQQITLNGDNFTLSPNPNKGAFVIEGTLNNQAVDKASIIITDLLGQVVYRQEAAVNNGVLNVHVALGNSVASGMYLVNIISGADNIVYHVVVSQ